MLSSENPHTVLFSHALLLFPLPHLTPCCPEVLIESQMKEHLCYTVDFSFIALATFCLNIYTYVIFCNTYIDIFPW